MAPIVSNIFANDDFFQSLLERKRGKKIIGEATPFNKNSYAVRKKEKQIAMEVIVA